MLQGVLTDELITEERLNSTYDEIDIDGDGHVKEREMLRFVK